MIRAKTRAELIEGLLRDGLTVRLPASGKSMLPLFDEGCILKVSAKAREVKAGDVIVYTSMHGSLVAHRLAGIVDTDGGRVYLACRDLSLTPDEPVTPERILGKVVANEGKPHGILRPAAAGVFKPFFLSLVKLKNLLVVAAYMIRSGRGYGKNAAA